MTPLNFAHLIDGIANATPDRTALLIVDSHQREQRISYGQLVSQVNRLGGCLQQLGLGHGDRVFVMMGKSQWPYLTYLALLKIGAVIIPASNLLRPDDIVYRVTRGEARAIITDGDLIPTIHAIQPQIPQVRHFLVTTSNVKPPWLSLPDLMARASNKPITSPVTPDDVAFISFTSGTTGGPKGVIHTYRWPFEHLKVAATVWFDAKPDDVAWATASPGWAKWVWSPFVSVLGNGATGFVYQGRFDAPMYLALMEKYHVSLLCATPTEYRLMAKADRLDQYHLSLRSATSAGEPLNREVIDTFIRRFGVTVRDGYGQTENTLLVGTTADMAVRPGSMGKPFPGLPVAIIDDQGEKLPVGATGHIAVHRSHPALFREYLNEPERTQAQFRKDWYVTGDQGRMDADGYIWFEGRSDDIIISSGYTIGPFEVEDALVKHPKVAECAVVASPDPERGHIVKAFVVLRNPEDAHIPDLVRELQDHVKTVTAPYKYPRAIEFVTSLPKTTSGKIRRIELRQQEAETHH